jgi:glycosyltransferase involved in cell wall biosynthesis
MTESVFDGGLSNYTYKLCQSLLSLNHKPYIFVCSHKDEFIYYDGIPVYRVNIKSYDNRLYYSNNRVSKVYSFLKNFLLRNFSFAIRYHTKLEYKYQSRLLNKSILNIHKEIKFDIIHYAHLGSVGFYRPCNIPCISRISSSTSEIEKHGGYGKNIQAVNAQESLEMVTLKKMDAIFGPSRMIAAIIEKEINRKIEIIETPYIEELVALDDTLYKQNLDGKKYLLFFGSIGLIKGCGTIAEIIYELLHQHPDLYFVFIGKPLHSTVPSMNMMQYIKHQAKDYSDRVLHFDKTPHPKLYPIISNCLFCVLPSRMDNFPNTCIEAMAHGKIVVGTLGNGFEQLIEQSENGFLIKVDDNKHLLETINKILLLSKEEKQRIEKNALKRIELLKPEKVVTQLVNFYKRTIEKYN